MAEQKYSILQKLDAGGMAEVWKGKATSMRGFEKLVAIKRVLPDLAKKNDFINMFLDEARLSLHLNHANVVQTFDIGTSEGAYFIVMEWVDGMNLKGVLESIQLSGDRIPVEQALFITKELCKGLHHAHRRKTPDGKPLNIVHRDISPPNLLISREGEIKVVDFGLAKAATQALATDQGMIKGKFSYLSPEAAWGKVVDERADIFAVGALLWEMLAGRRLFDGSSNKETVLMVREAHVPSLEASNPYVDSELMGIIYKSLAREPDERYSTSKNLGQDITNYLFKHQLNVSSYDIANLVEGVLAEKAKDKQLDPLWLDDLGEVEEQLVQFTSLDDLHQMTFKSVSEESGIHNPSLLKGEDPREWIDEFGVSFTPPPGQNTRLDLSGGEGSAKGAFSLTNQSPVPSQGSQDSAEQNSHKQSNGISSARQGPQSARQGVQQGEEETVRKFRWWLYPLAAIILMLLSLTLGMLLPRWLGLIAPPAIDQTMAPKQEEVPSQPLQTNDRLGEQSSDQANDQLNDNTEPTLDEDFVIEEDLNFE